MPLRSPLLLLVLALCAGCFSLTGRVEAELERALPRAIGPADRYDVHVEGLRARSGEARQVAVAGRRVRPEGAPALDRLDVRLFGVQYDRREDRLTRLDSARAAAWVRAEDLGAFLETRGGVQAASVTLRPPDRARLRVRPSVGGFALPGRVTVDGRLVSTEGRLHFEVSDVEAAGARLGGSVARVLTDAVNPLVDLTDAALALRVTAVRVEGGAVRLDAAAQDLRLAE